MLPWRWKRSRLLTGLTNQYGDAARAYAELSDHFADQLDGFPASDAALARILSGAAPQMISWRGPVRLTTSTNLARERARREWRTWAWMLDTGAHQLIASTVQRRRTTTFTTGR
jgi:hypothetical protein